MISYEQAKQMKELGLPQKRHRSAKYYVTPNIIMDFDAIHDLKDAKAWGEKRFEEQVNWMEHFTYIPELIDLIPLINYELTLDAAVYNFIDGRKSEQEELVKRTEEVLAPTSEPSLAEPPIITPETDMQIDSTLSEIEKLKEVIKNATQSPTPTI